MKILLIHYRYYEWGGPERYLFNITDALASRGHEVVPFSVAHQDNATTPFAPYFAPALGPDASKLFADQRVTPAVFWRKLQRTFYSRSIEHQLEQLIDLVKPDAVYVLQYLRHLSPAVLVAAKNRKLPLVVRLSDYELVCPQAHMLRKGHECEECLDRRSRWSSVKYGCVRDSRALSLLNLAAASFHDMRGYFDLVDRFVAPSQTMRDKMVRGGIDGRRIVHIPTFVDGRAFHGSAMAPSKRDQVLYLGQLRPEKGVDVLLRAWGEVVDLAKRSGIRLKIAGDGPASFAAELRHLAAARSGDTVEFVGSVPRERVANLLASARALVIPSICSENLPNVLLEAFASGTPVIASAIGSLREFVGDGVTGHLYPPHDVPALAKRLSAVITGEARLDELGENARALAATDFSPHRHVGALLDLFRDLGADVSQEAKVAVACS